MGDQGNCIKEATKTTLTRDIHDNSDFGFALAILSGTRVEAGLSHTGQFQGEGHPEIVDFRIVGIGGDKYRIVFLPLELRLRISVSNAREFNVGSCLEIYFCPLFNADVWFGWSRQNN